VVCENCADPAAIINLTHGLVCIQREKLRKSAGILAFAAALAFGQVKSGPDDRSLTPAEVSNQQNYSQPLRPQFHYTPIQGHIGDATGLIYYHGEYHLFHIYDEWSRQSAQHKRWGHAISPDLVHWQQLPSILDTVIDHAPGSGSGVVDWNNSSDLRTGVEKALLIFYTDYKEGTCIAYSHDRGRTWVRYSKNPVITGAEDARDPTVFWYVPTKEWRMVRYEKKGFAFYKSTDLLTGFGLAVLRDTTSARTFLNCRSLMHRASAVGFWSTGTDLTSSANSTDGSFCQRLKSCTLNSVTLYMQPKPGSGPQKQSTCIRSRGCDIRSI